MRPLLSSLPSPAQRASRSPLYQQLSGLIVLFAPLRVLAALRLLALIGLTGPALTFAASGPSVVVTAVVEPPSIQTEWPGYIAVDSTGTVYIQYDVYFGTVEIRKISPNGKTSQLPSRMFGTLGGFAVDRFDNFYVLDGIGLHKFKPDGTGMKLTPKGFVSEQDGSAPFTRLPSALAIAVDAPGENVYVLTLQQTILRITSDGSVTTLAGSAGERGSADGTTSARFSFPLGIAVDPAGNIFVADSGNHAIRKVTKEGVVSTFAGLSGSAGSQDGIGAAARFQVPYNMGADRAGNLYVSDQGLLRRVTATGAVTTLDVRGPKLGVSIDALAISANGSVYVSDAWNAAVWRGDFAPVITSLPTDQLVVIGASGVFRVEATSGLATTFQWQRDGEPIPGATDSALFVTHSQATSGAYTVVVTNEAGSTISDPVRLAVPEPNFVTPLAGHGVRPGDTITFRANATGLAPITYQWYHNDVPVAGAASSSLTITRAQPGDLGSYFVTATNAVGSSTSNQAALSYLSAADRLTNLAVRSNAGTGAQTLIVGFVTGGGDPGGSTPLLMRAVGPGLANLGVPGFLADPLLAVYSGALVEASNDNWQGSPSIAQVGAQVGAFALASTTSRDAAIYAPNLPAGARTIQTSGMGGSTGVALVEIYDASSTTVASAATPRLINLSARTQVGTGADILIAGFTIGGSAAKTLLIRAVGPTLRDFGVTAVLDDPKLEIFHGGSSVRSNDNWGGDPTIASAAAEVGAFALSSDSRDSALMVTLDSGSYTVHVTGVANTTGVALVEIYEVP